MAEFHVYFLWSWMPFCTYAPCERNEETQGIISLLSQTVHIQSTLTCHFKYTFNKVDVIFISPMEGK